MTYQQNRTMQQGRGNVRPQAGQSPAGNGLAGERAAIAALTALRNLQPEDLVSIAEKAGRFFSDNRIKTTQIRRIHEIRLLKYHLAYAAGRERNMLSFAEFFSPALDRVTDLDDLERFRQLFDAVLAYHKFFGSN